ncbi:MAG: Zn-dependent hydrolase [Clostridium sp.]|nr:Zn-dependent hydrolase [Lachnoclostridium sp.]MCM1253760.1 Zn-dependent hydrolase [Clostridium sp.]
MIGCSGQRMKEKIETFSRYGDTGNGGITRLSLSKEAVAARKEFVRRMQAVGAVVVTDDMANIYATVPGTENTAAIYSGSHMDSVRQGGNYDGILGVLSAMEAVETIVREKIPHKHPITVVVWTNEEGARFEPAMMSSGVVCGKFERDKMLASEAKDIPGYTFQQALEESGFQGKEENRMSPENCAAYVELHAEQGPVLDMEKTDIGVVEGVVGMVNYEFVFHGQSDHAGTTPMQYRKDALWAAAKGLQYLHENLDTLDSELVYTTGKIFARPNIHTVIPEEVRITIDARHRDEKVLKEVVRIIENIPKELAGCSVSVEPAWSRNTVEFEAPFIDIVERTAKELGYTTKRMYSGAGHDAQYVCGMVPATMIFVPSDKGHSHCELEYTPLENCVKGVNVLINTLLKIDALLS